MTPEEILRDKLRKIEALFAGAATAGERAAAGAAAERIRERLGRTSGSESPQEMRFSIPDIWSRQLFIALCRRYGLRPFRHRRMHRQTIVIKVLRGRASLLGVPDWGAPTRDTSTLKAAPNGKAPAGLLSWDRPRGGIRAGEPLLRAVDRGRSCRSLVTSVQPGNSHHPPGS